MEWSLVSDQGLPRPDIVFQLDADIDQIKNREGFGEEIYEREDFQRKIKKEFKYFHTYKYWKVINANADKDSIHKVIVDQVEKMLQEYNKVEGDEFIKNFYPNTIGEDLFKFQDI